MAKPWNWTPNDWQWCFGVNVFGVGYGVAAFVPRMIAGGEEGWVVNTSSGDGGFQPLPDLGVYASPRPPSRRTPSASPTLSSTKGPSSALPCSIPVGTGCSRPGCGTADETVHLSWPASTPTSTRSGTTRRSRRKVRASGGQVADLVALGRSVLQGIRDEKFIISLDTSSSGELLQQRAARIGRGELPTIKRGGVFE